MKSLHHNGPYIPTYSPVGLSITVKGRQIALSPEAENMIIQFVKKLDTKLAEDEVFVNNFLQDFAKEIGEDTLSLGDLDLTPVKEYLKQVQEKTASMTKEEKRLASQLKKQLREQLKQKYGYAVIDDVRVPIQNWSVEPASIFVSKGTNPLRGHWKRAIRKEDITLNLSPDAPMREQLEKEGYKIVWRPDEYWIAKWPEVFDPTRYKYIWISPATSLRQEKEKKKFDLANRLEEELERIVREITLDLYSEDEKTRKLATAVHLIMRSGIRVGDEKIAGERGTVGCTTLKPEHIVFLPANTVHLSFTGKDFVHWERTVTLHKQAYTNLQELVSKAGNDFIFKGLNSAVVSKYLKKKMDGLSAKVFRTFLAGRTWSAAALERLTVEDYTSQPDFIKKALLKLINLEVAKVLNHKKALPKNFQERLQKKREKLEQLKKQLREVSASTSKNREKKIQQLQEKILKVSTELVLLEETAEWNLNTSLTSYIDPRRVLLTVKQLGLQPKDIYSKSLLEKFSWALEGRQ